MTRPVLLLVPPLVTLPEDVGAPAALASLARAVRAQRQAERDLRLWVCRGGTAAEEAHRWRNEDVVPVVVSLGDPGLDLAAQALQTALGAVAATVAPLASDDLVALARCALHAGLTQDEHDACDFGPTAALAAHPLRACAAATLRRAHVQLAAEMFAGNHVAARNAALIENIVP